MNPHEKINYLEFPSSDLAKTKHFFQQVFHWNFTAYGEEYMAFSDAGIDGGFYFAPLKSVTENGAVLVVFFSEKLEQTMEKIKLHHGKINKPIFSFPGGRRFHFIDPTGNEFAVWSDK